MLGVHGLARVSRAQRLKLRLLAGSDKSLLLFPPDSALRTRTSWLVRQVSARTLQIEMECCRST